MWQAISYYALLVLETVVGVFGIRLYEEPRYEVIGRLPHGIETRLYGPRVAAEVTLSEEGGPGRSEAFQLLFNYIAGENRSASGAAKIPMTVPVERHEAERIAMTVPVQSTARQGGVLMRFFLPAKYRIGDAPRPLDPRVRLVTVPEETVAILRFSGTGAGAGARQAELIGKLAGSAWRPEGRPYMLYYDAPFTLPFLRRNEAAVAVTKAP